MKIRRSVALRLFDGIDQPTADCIEDHLKKLKSEKVSNEAKEVVSSDSDANAEPRTPQEYQE